MPTPVHEALPQQVSDSELNDLKEFHASSAQEHESLIKECELIWVGEDRKRKEHILPKNNALEEILSGHIRLREICFKDCTKILRGRKVAEGAYHDRLLNSSDEVSTILREDLVRVHKTISRMDTYIKWLIDDELLHRTSLDAYLKVFTLFFIVYDPQCIL